MTNAPSLNQFAKALCQHQRSGAQLNDLNLTSCDQKIQRAAADAGKPAGIWNSHADRLDR